MEFCNLFILPRKQGKEGVAGSSFNESSRSGDSHQILMQYDNNLLLMKGRNAFWEMKPTEINGSFCRI